MSRKLKEMYLMQSENYNSFINLTTYFKLSLLHASLKWFIWRFIYMNYSFVTRLLSKPKWQIIYIYVSIRKNCLLSFRNLKQITDEILFYYTITFNTKAKYNKSTFLFENLPAIAKKHETNQWKTKYQNLTL